MRPSLPLMVLWVLGVVAPLLACRPEPGEANVELAGSEGASLRTLADGDPIELVFGPQGGYHFDVGLWGQGVDPEGARLRYEVWEAGVDRPHHLDAVYALRAGRVTRGADGFSRADRALLDITDASVLVGHDVEVIVVLELPDGTELLDGRTLRVVDER